MIEEQEDTAVRTIGPSSGKGGDGLTGEFELTEETTTDPTTGSTKTTAISLTSTFLSITNRPVFLHFLQHVCDAMEKDQEAGVSCQPCQLAVELTYKDQSLRIETSLDKYVRR